MGVPSASPGAEAVFFPPIFPRFLLVSEENPTLGGPRPSLQFLLPCVVERKVGIDEVISAPNEGFSFPSLPSIILF